MVGMRMVEADYFQSLRLRIAFAAHQLFRTNQKTISLCLFLARIGDWIYLSTVFTPSLAKPPNSKPQHSCG